MAFLKIASAGTSFANATTLPDPAFQGFTITDTPVWSSNTGRALNAKMVGDIVAWKRHFKVKWAALSFAEITSMRNAIINAGEYFTLWYRNEDHADLTDETESAYLSITVYVSDIPRTFYSFTSGHRHVDSVEITFVEQ